MKLLIYFFISLVILGSEIISVESNTDVLVATFEGENKQEEDIEAVKNLMALANAFENLEEIEISYTSGLLEERIYHSLEKREDGRLYYIQALQYTGRMEGYITEELGKEFAYYLRSFINSADYSGGGDAGIEYHDGVEIQNPFYKAVAEGKLEVFDIE